MLLKSSLQKQNRLLNTGNMSFNLSCLLKECETQGKSGQTQKTLLNGIISSNSVTSRM